MGTAAEVSNSPAAAWSRTRAAMWTPMPAMSAPHSSISPVWSPARISSPNGRRAALSAGAADGASGALEGGEHPVARGPDEAALVLVHDRADHDVVALDEVAPLAVAERGGPLGGADDVGEEDRCQCPVRFGNAVEFGEKLLDVTQTRVYGLGVEHAVSTGHGLELGAWDVVGDVAVLFQRNHRVSVAV
jgi:hypothetical protein